MGTRGLTIVVKDGKTRVGQYGQWDHYPGGQGLTVLEFARTNLSTAEGREAFSKKLGLARFIEEGEHGKLWADVIGSSMPADGMVSVDKSEKFGKAYPSLSRNTGAEILNVILNATEEVPLQDQTEFATDSLYCEWAYVVDLDACALEVYRGFNTDGVKEGERFSHLFHEKAHCQYYPIRLAAKFSLLDLPSEESFLAHPAFKDPDRELN